MTGSPASTIPPKQLAIGVVGLGRIGRQHALNALHYVPRTKLLCACSPMDQDIEWAEEHLVPYGVKIYPSFDEMLQHPGLEALLIASTTKVHYEPVADSGEILVGNILGDQPKPVGGDALLRLDDRSVLKLLHTASLS